MTSGPIAAWNGIRLKHYCETEKRVAFSSWLLAFDIHGFTRLVDCCKSCLPRQAGGYSFKHCFTSITNSTHLSDLALLILRAGLDQDENGEETGGRQSFHMAFNRLNDKVPSLEICFQLYMTIRSDFLTKCNILERRTP